MIELKNVSFSYGDLQVLNDFSLVVPDGECVQLCGVSGSGKTTVLRIILGHETVQSGSITVPQMVSAVFQENRLLENIDVLKNIRLVLDKEKYDLADNLLNQFGIYDVRKKKVSTLSGGMKRRVALIRAIAYGGDALVLDEPFTGLDAENKKITAKIIKREFLNKGKSVLLITHENDDAELLSARTVNIK